MPYTEVSLTGSSFGGGHGARQGSHDRKRRGGAPRRGPEAWGGGRAPGRGAPPPFVPGRQAPKAPSRHQNKKPWPTEGPHKQGPHLDEPQPRRVGKVHKLLEVQELADAEGVLSGQTVVKAVKAQSSAGESAGSTRSTRCVCWALHRAARRPTRVRSENTGSATPAPRQSLSRRKYPSCRTISDGAAIDALPASGSAHTWGSPTWRRRAGGAGRGGGQQLDAEQARRLLLPKGGPGVSRHGASGAPP
jgi:hypothetical protein